MEGIKLLPQWCESIKQKITDHIKQGKGFVIIASTGNVVTYGGREIRHILTDETKAVGYAIALHSAAAISPFAKYVFDTVINCDAERQKNAMRNFCEAAQDLGGAMKDAAFVIRELEYKLTPLQRDKQPYKFSRKNRNKNKFF